MSTSTTQIQLKVSLSEQLNSLLQSKASRLGLPVTQFVKHLIIKEVGDVDYPIFEMSERTEKKIEQALHNIDKATEVDDISDLFKTL